MNKEMIRIRFKSYRQIIRDNDKLLRKHGVWQARG